MSMAAVIIVQSTDLHVCFVPWSFLDTLLVLSYQEVILLRDFIILRFPSTQLTRHFCTLYYLIYLDFTTLSVFFFLTQSHSVATAGLEFIAMCLPQPPMCMSSMPSPFHFI